MEEVDDDDDEISRMLREIGVLAQRLEDDARRRRARAFWRLYVACGALRLGAECFVVPGGGAERWRTRRWEGADLLLVAYVGALIG